MQDTIIKGTGNSRTLASVPNFLTLYPSYEAFGQALINRDLPIDLGPLNPTGLKVRGTDLNKENLLKDATAALYGFGADATPDQILNKIAPQIASISTKAKVISGSYIGNGAYGVNGPNQLDFDFPPKFVMIPFEFGNILSANYNNTSKFWLVDMSVLTESYQDRAGFGQLRTSSSQNLYPKGRKLNNGKTIQWYHETSAGYQCNYESNRYYFIAIG